jgi:transposase-like protein
MAKKAKWRRHTLEFKRQVVERMKTCQNIHELARELSVQRKLLYTWRYQFEGRPEPRHANLGITAQDRKEKQHGEEIAKLKAALADKTLENDFFRVPCSRSRKDARGVPRLAPLHLRRHPVVGARARHVRRGKDVPPGGGQPRQLLPVRGRSGAGRGGNGGTGIHPGGGSATPTPLRLSARYRRSAPPGDGHQSQTGIPNHAGTTRDLRWRPCSHGLPL